MEEREVVALVHADLATALAMGGGSRDEVIRHRSLSEQLIPQLRLFQVLGTLGPVSYDGDPRIVIQSRLSKHHLAMSATPTPPSPVGGGAAEWSKGSRTCERAARGEAMEVAMYCRLRGQTVGTPEQVWGPSSLERGVGGSEEAAIYLARELSHRGICVRVYGNPPPEEWGPDEAGVVWLPFYAYDPLMKVDVFVSWRNMDAVWLPAPASATAKFVWVHDPLALASDQEYFEPRFLRTLAGIFVLSRYSASQFAPAAHSKLIQTSNGIPPHLLRDGPNHAHRIMYASWPSSGLEEVLAVFPEIRKRVPGVELHVYGGFDWWWATPLYKDQPWFVEWRAKIEGMLQQEGVVDHGGVGHAEIAQAYADAGFYVYPTETRETAPINLIKAQANGCIPVTSKFPASAIPETTGDFDLGPPPRGDGDVTMKNDPEWLREWTEAVITAVSRDPASLREHRDNMKNAARAAYSWPTIAAEWEAHFLEKTGYDSRSVE